MLIGRHSMSRTQHQVPRRSQVLRAVGALLVLVVASLGAPPPTSGDARRSADSPTNTWRPLSITGAPAGRYDHTAVWTGAELIVWGGQVGSVARGDRRTVGDGARYRAATDTWAPVARDGAPTPRVGHAAAWTGSQMIVWGG